MATPTPTTKLGFPKTGHPPVNNTLTWERPLEAFLVLLLAGTLVYRLTLRRTHA